MLVDAASGKMKMPKPTWYQAIGKYAYPNLRKSLWQLLDTFVPYCILWALMLCTVRQGYPYWVTLALAVVAGGILVRVFILFHDCCHGSFFASRRANTILGYVAGILTFTPYEDWRYAHNIHHATQGDIDRQGVGDIWDDEERGVSGSAPAKTARLPDLSKSLCVVRSGPDTAVFIFPAICYQRRGKERAPQCAFY